MILPTKGVPPNLALLTIGGQLLDVLDEPATTSSLWYRITKLRGDADPLTFDWYVLALDLLCALQAITMESSGLISRSSYD